MEDDLLVGKFNVNIKILWPLFIKPKKSDLFRLKF